MAKPEAGGLPQVLNRLDKAILVAESSHSAADLLQLHAALWRWIEKLSPAGEQHEVAILFVMQPLLGDAFAGSLALGLGLELFVPSLGHGVARMGDSLESLCRTASTIRPCDLPPLLARQAGNARHKLIRKLIKAESPNDLVDAARAVSEGFRGQEYLLDLFCRPPGHRNGNLFRAWLREAVRGGISFETIGDAKSSLATWLRDG
ncbi:MAG TPA: hypothetical protein PLX89_04800 [Verrucomicrobiota bacterium]|nr:hypothetical protein [Verrucomicrobiota bacterium]